MNSSQSDILNELFVNSNIDFNVICISKTTQQVDYKFAENNSIESSKAGVAIFVKNNY